jgi:hypothetical protein
MNNWLVLLIAATVALAAAQQPAEARSCSDFKKICLSKGSKKCAGTWKECMRTGIYIGPDSGINHGYAEKQ